MTEINGYLSRITTIQEDIKQLHEEQPGPNKPLLATLQGLSQYYLDYLSKQKTEDEVNKKKQGGNDEIVK
ncbi:hypothetical protein ACFLWN_00635 [Chloroflexota bacterium]